MPKRRVVVTGLGIVSSMGNTVPKVWENVVNGKSGVHLIESLRETELLTKIGANVPHFDSSLALSHKDARRTDLFVQYAVEASRQALEDAGLIVDDALAPRAGVAIGSGIGGLPWIEKSYEHMLQTGVRKISPFFIPGAIINMSAGFVSMKYNLKGPNISIVTACTTGTHNIGTAARMIAYDDADVMVAGGTEMATSQLGIGGFNAARALSQRNDDPERASRPWDRDRDGFVLGEGAGVLVLEEYEFAKKRGAKIYAELVGFGMSGDAYHMTSPEPDGAGFVMSMENTLRDAKVTPEEIDYINAHGTSTQVGDPLEAQAVKKVFGDHAYKMAVSSTKSMTGHLLGAAGAVEAIFSVLAIRDQVAPPTINLDNPDEGCDLNFVPHQAQEMKIELALSNSFGFGGTNGSLLFRKIR
jgi:3-oxoacyl-[acyl-carrier-protein] synthase II